MRCSFCNNRIDVMDSREIDGLSGIVRRRRYCPNCDRRITTVEMAYTPFLQEYVRHLKEVQKQEFKVFSEEQDRDVTNAIRQLAKELAAPSGF